MRRLLRGRGLRKLLRQRTAVLALIIVGAYGLFAFCVLAFDLIAIESTVERIGPGSTPGFLGSVAPEKRLANAEETLYEVDAVLEARDPEKAIAEYHLAERKLRPATPEELAERAEAAWTIYDEIEDDYAVLEEGDAAAIARLADLEEAVAGLFLEPRGLDGAVYWLRHSLGTDRQGRSILMRALYAIKVAVQIGFVAALISVTIGTLLGGAAAFFGGWVDHAVVWLYSTFSSIPYIVLLMLLAAIFHNNEYLKAHFGQSLLPVYAAFCMSFWIAPCRVVRGEVLKIKELEYVQAATSVGFGRLRILLRHVIPNTVHLMFINFSLLFIGAIKAEVILSFLGLGVKDEPSWGVMINHAKPEVIEGFFWQIGAATFFMLVLVLAFNTLSDALQDAFDPKHV